jgi:hypothetical protein
MQEVGNAFRPYGKGYLCRYIKKQSRMVARDRLALLAIVPVFQTMEQKLLRALALVSTLRTFHPSAVIFNQDQDVEDLHIISSGHVKLVRELPKRSKTIDPGEFQGFNSDNPFRVIRPVNKKFTHVQSPVKQYRSKEPDNIKLREHRKEVLKSARAKVTQPLGMQQQWSGPLLLSPARVRLVGILLSSTTSFFNIRA